MKGVDQLMREYPQNLRLLELLRDEYDRLRESSDMRGQNYEEGYHGRVRRVNRPVENYVVLLERLERSYDEILHEVMPIRRLVDDLTFGNVRGTYEDGVMYDILSRHYWLGESLESVRRMRGLSRRSIERHRDNLRECAREYERAERLT